MKSIIHFNPLSELHKHFSFNASFINPIDVVEVEQCNLNSTNIEQALQKIWKYSLAGKYCVGYMDFEAAIAFDCFETHNSSKSIKPILKFAIYNSYEATDINIKKHDVNLESELKLKLNINIEKYTKDFNLIHDHIKNGDVYQINYTQKLRHKLLDKQYKNINWQQYYYQLLNKQPNAYSMYIDDESQEYSYKILSFSPELFFSWNLQDNGYILTQPMKGTAKRDKNKILDELIKYNLVNNQKEQAENIMIVDLLRNDISKIAQLGSIKTSNIFECIALPTVWQMVSSVTANTTQEITLYDIFKALFPCGSITGAPKIQAMKIIKALEKQQRGTYCGIMGIIKPYGECIFNVSIRTLEVYEEHIEYGVGSGITIDATLNAEIQELKNKLSFLF
jgi:para-aminobenzoate synthetase / 4-amino-4-deoxychorismate lyase